MGNRYKDHVYLSKITFPFPSDLPDVGSCTGFFSRHDGVDSYGDICAPGFLDESIKERAQFKKTFPLYFGHDQNQIVGAIASIWDTPQGYCFEARFFDTPRAAEIRTILKANAVYQCSFAYQTQKEGLITLEDGRKANELRKCTLYEISLVPVPAMDTAVITAVKGTAAAYTAAPTGKRTRAEIEAELSNLLKQEKTYEASLLSYMRNNDLEKIRQYTPWRGKISRRIGALRNELKDL